MKMCELWIFKLKLALLGHFSEVPSLGKFLHYSDTVLEEKSLKPENAELLVRPVRKDGEPNCPTSTL